MRTLARQRDKADLVDRLRTLHPASVRRWGRMSAHQMVCHLADSFRMATGEIPVSRETHVLERTLLKWAVLYLPVRWPAGILTSPEIDQELRGTKPLDFAADVTQVEALMEGVTRETASLGRQDHPMFGRMSGAEWLRWGYLHTDHHLRQFGV